MPANAYFAANEGAEVYAAYGDSPAEVLEQMALLLKEHGIDWWHSASVGVDTTDSRGLQYLLTIYT